MSSCQGFRRDMRQSGAYRAAQSGADRMARLQEAVELISALFRLRLRSACLPLVRGRRTRGQAQEMGFKPLFRCPQGAISCGKGSRRAASDKWRRQRAAAWVRLKHARSVSQKDWQPNDSRCSVPPSRVSDRTGRSRYFRLSRGIFYALLFSAGYWDLCDSAVCFSEPCSSCVYFAAEETSFYRICRGAFSCSVSFWDYLSDKPQIIFEKLLTNARCSAIIINVESH